MIFSSESSGQVGPMMERLANLKLFIQNEME